MEEFDKEEFLLSINSFPQHVTNYFENILLGGRKMATDCDEYPTDCEGNEDRAAHHASCALESNYKDECDRARGLLQCLALILQSEDYHLYRDQPHTYLIEAIETAINDIEGSII